ncbi:hypothetical protein MBSD_n0957 [Mizugakiibacter sediminis]|nr:hypothetical protein MBSD_n0957 [Mizugakiibacter sediminis]
MSGWNALPEAVRRERQATGIRQWRAWAERHKASIVDPGSPLGRTKAASPAGIADVRNAMTAYVIVRAETHDQAVRLFEGHPHFSVFPGTSVEVMECLPIPADM